VARLLLESGGERRETRIAGILTIGRSPSVSIPLDDKTLSREHTQVYPKDGKYFVRDLGSKNGTYVNGRLINQPTQIKHGDRVKVGPAVTFMLLFDPDDVEPEAPRTATAATRPAPATAATRPAARREPLSTLPGPIARFFHLIVFLGVLAVGSWFAKGLFITMVLPRIPK
jgi:predicted component of type VI protein secretion system